MPKLHLIKILVFVGASLFFNSCFSGEYKIGVYYFPGWRNFQTGAAYPEPWKKIQPFAEREPLLGWYDDGAASILEQQTGWMRDYGIDFVIFDWYWNGSNPQLNHSIDSFISIKNNKPVDFTILWANHSNIPRNKKEFTLMVWYWITKYFSNPDYLRIDGKPVVFIFSHDNLLKSARLLRMTVPGLLGLAEEMARNAGLSGIYFVGSTHWEEDFKASGYSAISNYNYHGLDKESESYEELDFEYRKIWNKVGTQGVIPYFVPMTQGWDRRPWGGSRNPKHDNSKSTPATFEKHLIAAKKFMDLHPSQTEKTGVICCWNEYGEGSVIEPTKFWGFKFLDAVNKTFK